MRLRSAVSILAASLLAACTSTPAAEDPRPDRSVAAGPEGTLIRVGEVQEGVITAADPEWGDHGPFHLYRFQATAGQRVILEMTSDDFDTYLVIGDKSGGIFNPIAQDDDAGGDYDARIRFIAPETATYWVLAQAYGESVGSYVLTLNEIPAPRAPQAVPLSLDQSVQGELSPDDALDEYDEKSYDLYTFQAESGRRYSVTLASFDFDAYLVVGRGTGADFEEISRNDDSGDNTNARVVFIANETGTYAIRATSFDVGSTGAYTISVDEMAAPGPLVVTPVRFGATASGSLAETDRYSDDGSYYDLYRFSGREGQRVSITMSAPDIDSYLELGEGGEEFWADYSDDDSGGNLDARIVRTLWRTGEFTVRATSVYPEQTGDYTLTIEELPESGPVQVREIRIGQTIDGSLEPTDATLDDDSYHDIYTFRAQGGDRISITLRSDDFDSYVSLGEWSDGDIEVTDSDDDSGGGTSGLDSQLQLTIPSDGVYAIQVNSLGAHETGEYTLSLERQ